MRNPTSFPVTFSAVARWLALPAAVFACGTLGCGTNNADLGNDGGPGTFQGNGTDPCSGGQANNGCPCTQMGNTAACWTGPAASRNQPGCHDGTAQCIANGEFATWGPCVGESLMCVGTPGGGNEDGGGIGPPGGGNEDGGGIGPPGGGKEDGGGIGPPGGGNEDGGSGPPGGGNEDSGGIGPPGGGNEDGGACACKPGAVIWCDEDCSQNIICSSSSQKTCQPDGTWSACHETGAIKPPNACEDLNYGCGHACVQGTYTGDCTGVFACSTPPTCTSGNGVCPTNPPGTGTCPAACTGGCANGTCTIDCATTGGCSSNIVCPDGFSCSVQCNGTNWCNNITIQCPSTGSCAVSCQGTGACAGSTLECGSGSCTATCVGHTVNGDLAAVHCNSSCSCTYTTC